MSKPKFGLITGFLGETKDRFRSYNSPKTLEEKFEMMSKIEGVDGVEIVYPYEVGDAETCKALLNKYNLNVAAINCNIKGEEDFVLGSISHHNPEIRAKAVRFIKEAKDFAIAVGADKVQCCPLGDGYEYSMQSDYATTWKYMVECLKEAGSYKPEIKLYIEYKPNEIRGKCFLNSCAKTLCMLNEVDNENVGITLDFGHSVYGGENPAEALCLVAESRFPYYIHINDNDGNWDWDYMCCSHNMQKYMEFVYYLKRYGYNDYLTSDTSPTRVEIIKCFEANARWTEKIWNIFDEATMKELTEAINQDDFHKNWKLVEEKIFKL